MKKEDVKENVIVDDVERDDVLDTYFSLVFALEELGKIPELNQAFLDSGMKD